MGRKTCPAVEATTCSFVNGWIIRRGSEGELLLQSYKARLADYILAVGEDVVHFINLLISYSNEISKYSFSTLSLSIIGQGSPTKISRSDPPNGKRTLNRQENGQSIKNSNPTLQSLHNLQSNFYTSLNFHFNSFFLLI